MADCCFPTNKQNQRAFWPTVRGMGAWLGLAIFLAGKLGSASIADAQVVPALPLVPPAPPQEPPAPNLQSPQPQPLPMAPIPFNPAPLSMSSMPMSMPMSSRITIDFTNTPVKDLLPERPKMGLPAPRLTIRLDQVPEIAFQEPLAKNQNVQEAQAMTALRLAKMHHLNKGKTDGFMVELLKDRTDLAGVSFAMGDACRMKEERARQFALALDSYRKARVELEKAVADGLVLSARYVLPNPGYTLIQSFEAHCRVTEKVDERASKSLAEQATLARIAVLMQVLATESPQLRLGLVKYLAGITHVEATRSLARLVIFSEETEVRDAALEALKVRREKDYDPILLQGLSYPWPAVAKRSSEAMAKLEREDLIPQLIDVLDKPDPRAPYISKAGNKKNAMMVRELVRVNHHRNCMLCHSPGIPEAIGDASPGVRDHLTTFTAQVPVPQAPLPGHDGAPLTAGNPYGNSVPDVLIRIDVTYLRQDFSLKLAVAESQPWPEMQRFDFLVRTREISDKEAKAHEALFRPSAPGVLSPYHRAALAALRELSGRDTEPTAEAWRKLLSANNEKGALPLSLDF